MNLVEQLKQAYDKQEWDGVANALKMLGVEVTQKIEEPMAVVTEGKVVKGGLNPPPKTKARPKPHKGSSTTIDMEEFKVKPANSSGGWQDIPMQRTNLFVDTKEDIKFSGPYRPEYKNGKRPKGVKAEYPSYEQYLQEVMYSKTKNRTTTRPPANKVKIKCAKCNKTYEEYPSTIRYTNPEEKTWWCNDCSGKQF
jgi:hypothetical protein